MTKNKAIFLTGIITVLFLAVLMAAERSNSLVHKFISAPFAWMGVVSFTNTLYRFIAYNPTAGGGHRR